MVYQHDDDTNNNEANKNAPAAVVSISITKEPTNKPTLAPTKKPTRKLTKKPLAPMKKPTGIFM